MAFPFKTKPSDDLRALFKYQRLKEHAQDLKHSSIGPGGSLDVVNSSGTVIASLGDFPGGQGFGLRDGGTVKDVRGLFASDGRMTTAEGRLDSHASRLGATENVANGVHNEVTTARGGFGSLNSRLNDHVSRIGANQGELENARGGYASLATRLTLMSNAIGALADRVDTLETQMAQVRSWLQGQPGWPP